MSLDQYIEVLQNKGEMPISVFIVTAKPKTDSEFITVTIHPHLTKPLPDNKEVEEIYINAISENIFKAINTLPNDNKTKTSARNAIKKAYNKIFKGNLC